jgi:aminoglycoside phosphotransferase
VSHLIENSGTWNGNVLNAGLKSAAETSQITDCERTIKRFKDKKFVKEFFKTNLHKIGIFDLELVDCRISALKDHHRKSVFEFTLYLQSRSSPQITYKSLVGKIRTDVGRQKDVFDLLNELWINGFDEHSLKNKDLKMYEPLAYFDDYNLLLTSKAQGRELGNIVSDKVDHASLLRYIEQTANWLIKLHSTKIITHTKNHSSEEESKRLIEWDQNLSLLHPTSADKVHAIVDRILRIEQAIDPKNFVLIHGDFHLMNIFVDRTDLTVIDFDRSCIFEPAKDVGYFLAHLQMRLNKIKPSLDATKFKERFVECYSMTMTPRYEFIEMVSAFEASSYLEHLNFVYGTLHKKFNTEDFEYWINMAEKCLEG